MKALFIPAVVAALLGLSGCCLEVENGRELKTAPAVACANLSAAPADVASLVVFSPNPAPFDAGVRLTSQDGLPTNAFYVVRVLDAEGTFVQEVSVNAIDYDRSLLFPMENIHFAGPTSWAADDGGDQIIVQELLDGSGSQRCTALGERCGGHGPCCTWLSCQADDGGCACAYAWPQAQPWPPPQ